MKCGLYFILEASVMNKVNGTYGTMTIADESERMKQAVQLI